MGNCEVQVGVTVKYGHIWVTVKYGHIWVTPPYIAEGNAA